MEPLKSVEGKKNGRVLSNQQNRKGCERGEDGLKAGPTTPGGVLGEAPLQGGRSLSKEGLRSYHPCRSSVLEKGNCETESEGL